jgi:hypothetical protein
MKKTCLLAAAAGMACCSVALAKPPIEMARPGVQVEPISVAKVMKVNGQIVLAGDWMPYTGGFGSRSAPLNTPFFDSFGREPGTAPTGGAGTQCPVGCTTQWGDLHTDDGTRWYFGSAYHNPNTIEDMQDCACPPSSVISEIDLGWFWCPQTVGENCIIIYFPLEEVLAFDPITGLCNDESTFTDTGGGGVALNYGALAPGCPFYYFSRVAGVEVLGVLSPATDDNGDANGFADGSYQMIVAQAITSSAIILANGPTQPMLWGTSNGWQGTQGTGPNTLGGFPGDCRPGNQNGDSYDDDAPTDGILSNPAECYDYTFGICPNPLGKDNCFCYLRCPADYNNDGFVDGIDADSFNNAFEAGSSCSDLNGDCFVDGIDSDYFANEFESACP